MAIPNVMEGGRGLLRVDLRSMHLYCVRQRYDLTELATAEEAKDPLGLHQIAGLSLGTWRRM